QANFAAAPHILIGKDLTFLEIGPVANVQERWGGTVNVHRHPILVAVNDLHTGTDHGRNIHHGGTFTPNGVAILRSQCQDAPTTEADASAGSGARLDHNNVGTHAGDGLFDGRA